ncbi:MAG: RNA polymerase subunit sigma-24 [Bacteroidetes bacterium HGW-Bacteroidetes-6]|jgi:RNA polymerase sigma-70 factor (ECF subfamily)|nr:MAG: RNA polymerase subunit sigma-24 [Bacteroidetes bacterium HGW-Bacteroidetes-6]
MKTQPMSDELLVRNYINGDHKCFQKLVSRYRRKLYGYIYIAVKDSMVADDIFQDTFLKVVTTLQSGSYREEGKFIQWIMRIAHNQIIDYFRKNNKFPQVSVNNDSEDDVFTFISSEEPNVEDRMITDQIHSTLGNLVEMLPDDQREVLKMRIYYDMSFKEIAEETNVSINTALGRMRYALINLRRIIKDKEGVLIS